MHIGGWKTHRPAARIAMLDRRLNGPVPSQQLRRLVRAPFSQRLADLGGYRAWKGIRPLC